MFYLLIVGSRSFEDYSKLSSVCDKLLSNYSEVTIVSGGAVGADSLAERYASERGYGLVVFPVDWACGKGAGFARNRTMHQYISKFPHRGCVAFWDGKSKGTTHSFELAKRYNNQLRIIRF